MSTIFSKQTAHAYIGRVNCLEEGTKPLWGKMNCTQMLAHCSGAFFESSKKPNLFWKFKIRLLLRHIVIGEKPYPKNMKTARIFINSEACDFEIEKSKLIKGIERVQYLGPDHFLTQKHPIFGRMSVEQWNTFFTKHLDHHLTQFGV